MLNKLTARNSVFLIYNLDKLTISPMLSSMNHFIGQPGTDQDIERVIYQMQIA